ncbi:Abi family protein [Isoptericola sp. BMS4]|uniref:Abi family protein n=1 Tax=Isoptericola sp. BMS4 TaxID=2527875 RepID=UPI001421F7DD|nr:Abi family protein [Isoptericola sp. BMS4]
MSASTQARARGPRRYDKPALAHDDLVDRMVGRGLVVLDRDRTRRYLRHIGYYRFSPYLIPFRTMPAGETLRDGTTFDQVLDLYVFDRKLRLLVTDAIERVEVAVRAALTDTMSLRHGGPFWYVDGHHFRDQAQHAKFLGLVRKICRDQLRNDEETPPGELAHASALEHYLTSYGEPELPPSWLMVESLTLGQLESVIANLRRISDVKRIARPLGLSAPILTSWLRTYVRVRNVCAHHGRLWNVGLGVYPAIPTGTTVTWLDAPDILADTPDRRRRLYPVLVSLQSVLAVVSPRSSWAQRLSDLLDGHPEVPFRGMGIPATWREDPFWAEILAEKRPSAP